MVQHADQFRSWKCQNTSNPTWQLMFIRLLLLLITYNLPVDESHTRVSNLPSDPWPGKGGLLGHQWPHIIQHPNRLGSWKHRNDITPGQCSVAFYCGVAFQMHELHGGLKSLCVIEIKGSESQISFSRNFSDEATKTLLQISKQIVSFE